MRGKGVEYFGTIQKEQKTSYLKAKRVFIKGIRNVIDNGLGSTNGTNAVVGGQRAIGTAGPDQSLGA